MRTCEACRRPDVERIEDALRAGTPVRQVAREYGLGRNIVARHADHMEPQGGAVVSPVDLRAADATTRILAAAEEASNALDRVWEAGRLPLVLSALRGARAAARQVRRGYQEREASDADRAKLEALYERSVQAYSRSIGRGGLEFSALEGLRSTLDDLRAAAGHEQEGEVLMVVHNFDGSPTRGREGGGVLIPAGRLPPKYRKGKHVIQLRLRTTPREMSLGVFAASAPHGNGERPRA